MDVYPTSNLSHTSGPGPGLGVWLLVILGVLILIAIIIGIIVASRASTPAPSSTTRNLSTTTGPTAPVITQTSTTITEPSVCSLEPQKRQWIVDSTGKGNCQCIYPFTGPTCEREQVDPGYQEVALAGSTNYSIQPLYTTSTSHLTYGSGSNCTNFCNLTDNCIGVVYNNHVCTLVTGQVKYQGQAPKLHGNLYVKRNSPVVLENQLVVYTGQLPADYWTTTGPNYQVLEANKVYRLNFVPTKVLGNVNWTGILSPNLLPLDYATLQSYLKNPPPTVSVLASGEPQVAVPAQWLLQKANGDNSFYVVFLPKK